MISLVVTRHPALVEYLLEIGLADSSTQVIAHASVEAVQGRHAELVADTYSVYGISFLHPDNDKIKNVYTTLWENKK